MTVILFCRLHIMAGRKTDSYTEDEMRKVYIDNLKFAADKLSKHNITALIEPVNSKLSAPGYFMDRLDKGMAHDSIYLHTLHSLSYKG